MTVITLITLGLLMFSCLFALLVLVTAHSIAERAMAASVLLMACAVMLLFKL